MNGSSKPSVCCTHIRNGTSHSLPRNLELGARVLTYWWTLTRIGGAGCSSTLRTMVGLKKQGVTKRWSVPEVMAVKLWFGKLINVNAYTRL